MHDASDLAPIPHHGAIVVRRVVARVIDDGLLLAGAIGIAALSATLLGDFDAAGERIVSGIPVSLLTRGQLPALVAASFATGMFIAYIGVASLFGGRTLGRIVTNLRVIRSDGREPAPSVLFGRELVRVALICLSLAIVAPIMTVLASATLLAGRGAGPTTAVILASTASILPVLLGAAGWIGATAVDEHGRAPHDRLAKTRVVRR